MTGWQTLLYKEVLRFWKVGFQTVAAPVITSLMYLLIFGFGTVLGMMAAFGRLGTGDKVQPSQIAAEISVALICTAMGLATAIPFNYILASLSIRLRMLQESLSFGLSSFLEHCKGMQAKTAEGRAGAWK